MDRLITILKSFLWDIVVILVLLVNLLLMVWDWFFAVPYISGWLMEHTPDFHAFYSPIHENMVLYDLMFVGVYVLDLLVGWCISVFRTKEKFLEYPIAHWYDVLGCIPVGSLVYLRLLRLVSVVIRLYKMKVLNLAKFKFFRICVKYYNIVLEEVSDRVVLNILGGIKSNVQLGMPITREVLNKIILPHKQQIINLIFSKIQTIARHEYNTNRHDIAMYISEKSRMAVSNNKELNRLKLIPVVGSQIQETIEHSVSQTMVQVVDSIVEDALSDEMQNRLKSLAGDVADAALDNLEADLSKIVTEVVCEVVDIIARTANVKQWKLTEIREQIAAARQAENPDEELINRLEAEYSSKLSF